MASHTIARHRAAAIKVVSNWSTLIPGDFVTVVDSSTFLHAGWIDDLTEDGSIIWLVLASGLGRRMFFREDGHRIMVEASQPYAKELDRTWHRTGVVTEPHESNSRSR